MLIILWDHMRIIWKSYLNHIWESYGHMLVTLDLYLGFAELPVTLPITVLLMKCISDFSFLRTWWKINRDQITSAFYHGNFLRVCCARVNYSEKDWLCSWYITCSELSTSELSKLSMNKKSVAVKYCILFKNKKLGIINLR